MHIRSMAGLVPLFAVETLETYVLDNLPDFSGASRLSRSGNQSRSLISVRLWEGPTFVFYKECSDV